MKFILGLLFIQEFSLDFVLSDVFGKFFVKDKVFKPSWQPSITSKSAKYV